MTPSKRVAILSENGFEESELTSPKKAMEDAGIKVDIVSPQKEKVKGWNHDHWSIELPVDVNLSTARMEDYDALVIPGGVMNPDLMRVNKDCIKFAKDFMDAGKPVAAICHAAQLLAGAGVLKGRRCSCYPAVAPDVTAAGGTYVELPIDKACVDGNLVTAPAWPAHPAWLSEFLKVMGTKLEVADRVA